MDKLAKALLALNWSDMDDFAIHLQDTIVANEAVTTDEIDPRFISQTLIDWAHENRKT